MMKRLLLVLLMVMMLSTLSGLPVQAGTDFRAMLSGAQEVPAVNTMATGEAVFTLSPDGMSITYRVTVSNINDVFASHIHMAPAGVNGPVVVPLFAGAKPGPFTGILAEGTITAANLSGPLLGMPLESLLTAIKAGNTYVNVHTTAHPGGEIRGQIMVVMP